MMAMVSMAWDSNQLQPWRGHVPRNDNGKLPNGSLVRHVKPERSDENEGMIALARTDFIAYTKGLSRSESSSTSKTDAEQLLSAIIQELFCIFKEHLRVGVPEQDGDSFE
jgi:hypothetical protein